MIVVIVLLVAAGVAAVLVGLRRQRSGDGVIDVDAEEQWLVRHAPPRIARFARTLDRRFAGGVAVGASFVVVFATALIVGWIFSGLDDQRGFARWDEAAATFGRDHATVTSTRILESLTDLGGTVYLLGAMALVGVYHSVRRKDWGPLLYLGAVGIGITLLNNGLKLIVDRDRPEISQLAAHAGSSFPSGHSAAAAACWAGMALVVARRRGSSVRIAAGFIAVFIACAVATTRVLLGVHWLTDVIAGVLVGWAWFTVVTVVFGGRALRLGEVADRVATKSNHLDASGVDAEGQRIS